MIHQAALLLLFASLLMNFSGAASTAAQPPATSVNKGQAANRTRPTASRKPLLIAHRGASGDAPEHTLAAYGLAIEQGADFVEQDLQITKDGVLICLHDPELSRTTNVRQVFPERFTKRDAEGKGTPKKGWYAVDFTLAEIKKLDAGSWFYQLNAFAAADHVASVALPKTQQLHRIPTLQEVIQFVRHRRGLYIEVKDYEYYQALGFDMVKMLAAVLQANGYATAKRRTEIFIQSFSPAALVKMKKLAPQYARIQLLPMEDPQRQDTAQVTAALAKEYAAYAQGVGPAKQMLKSATEVEIFHAAGLLIHPYTFRGATTAMLRKPLEEMLSDHSSVRQNLIADIQHYLAYGIDGGFTDYPALWKEAVKATKP
ncbi:MAG: glycerophosphodiester phosphodiesterase [Acidobacteria bacterium]|nr:glycerophosphodiester phosphodiesterase [Acidobacteriota bacterium]